MTAAAGRKKSRIALGGWLLVFLAVFFYRGYPAATLVLLFTAIYLIAAFLFVRMGGRNLRIGLFGGDLVEKGEPMEVRVNVTNGGKLPVFCCTCELEAENRLTGTAKHQRIRLSLPPGGSAERILTLSDVLCGKILSDVRRIIIEDPLRVFAAEREIKNRTAESSGYVSPQIRTVTIPEDWLDSYNMESYQYSQYEKGSDPGEVFGLREYQEGDSPKQIHWKLSAKLGEMTVKIPSFPIENNILVILDNLLEPGAVMEGPARSRLTEDFCSLSMSLIEKNIPHSIGWVDTAEEHFCLRRVSGPEELMGLLPEILGCGFAESEASAVYRYLESGDTREFSNHFLVTGQGGRDTERLESRGAVKLFQTKE